MKNSRGKAIFVILLGAMMALTSCQKQEEQAHFQPIEDFLLSRGYEDYILEPLKDQGRKADVPIYDETVWHSLRLGTEEVLVYFDSSNRAKQLANQFCRDDENQKVVSVGLRFILCYWGTDEKMIGLMDEWQKEYPA